MGLPNVMQTGRNGMVAAKANIATTGHNITNSTTEGFSRQRVEQEAMQPTATFGNNIVGNGVKVARTERINDEYLEKQIRNSAKDMAHMEDKDLVLRQTEDIFNEMGGEGLNRLMGRFFNEFRKLANEPDSQAIRESVREASQAMVNDFKRVRKEVNEVRRHIDSRIDGYSKEVNALAMQVRDLNLQIKQQELTGASPNDLKDRRDLAVKKLGSYMDLSIHKDGDGQVSIDVRNVGPLVTGPMAENFSVSRTPADAEGKIEDALDIKSSGAVTSAITHKIKGGKIGALLEVRDQTLNTIMGRLDELAYNVANAVNDIHSQGFTADNLRGVSFFKVPEGGSARAAEFIDLSDEVKSNVNFIASAAQSDSPGDNRIAIALSGLQGMRLMNDGQATVDDFYNSIVSDVGVATARNRESMGQAKDIQTQLSKFRDQISGVSIDEETANLMQFQHAFGASAKVIQVADEMLKTVLDLKR